MKSICRPTPFASLSPEASILAVLRVVIFAIAVTAWPMGIYAQLAPGNLAGVSWGHIHMNVSDVEEHVRIWVEHFGGVRADVPVATVVLPNTLLMFNAQAPTGGTQGSSIDHFGFSVPNVAEFLERWRADGLEVESEFNGFGDLPQAYLRLPDDIRVELEEVPSLTEVAVPYHVHLYTDGETEALRDWFVEQFSMEPRERGFNPYTADVPGMNVSFSSSEEPLERSQGRAVDHIGFEIENLEAFVESLTASGVVLDAEYRVIESLGIGLAFFTDASGTYWELTERLGSLAERGGR